MNSFQELLPYTIKLNKLKRERKWDLLNAKLKISIQDKSNLQLVALLRNTFSCREELPDWQHCLNAIEIELRSRLDETQVRDMLIGLI